MTDKPSKFQRSEEWCSCDIQSLPKSSVGGWCHVRIKVNVPISVTYLNRSPVFELYAFWCSSNNRYQKDMCYKEIPLHVQNMITFLGSSVNLIGGTYMTI